MEINKFICIVSDAVDQQLLHPRQQSSDVSFDLLETLPAGMVLRSVVCRFYVGCFFLVSKPIIFDQDHRLL